MTVIQLEKPQEITIQDLVSSAAEAFKEADKEYQFAFASGDSDRLTEAISARNKTFAKYRRLKVRQMNMPGYQFKV